MLFGEWCYAVHSVEYTKLPDYFLALDIYDRKEEKFLSVDRRNKIVYDLGMYLIPQWGNSICNTIHNLSVHIGESFITEAPMEGIYIRQDQGDYLLRRAKLVRPGFIQNIDEHWSKKEMKVNKLDHSNEWYTYDQ